MKKTIILFLFVGLVLTVNSQQMQCAWINQAGGSGWDIVSDITTLPDGQILITGTFYDSIFFETDTLISNGSRDIFIATYQADGSFNKAVSFGASGYDYAKKVVPLNEGGFLVPIQFNKMVEIDGQEFESKHLNNLMLSWFDKNMKPTFQTILSSNGKFDITNLRTASDGDIYFSGWFTDTLLTENKEYISRNAEDIFLGKISNQGKLRWIKQFEGEGSDKPYSFISKKEDTNYLVGITSKGCSENKKAPTSVPDGMRHLFISQINSSGKEDDIDYPVYGYEIEPIEMLEDSSELWLLANFKYSSFLNMEEISSHGKNDVLLVKYNLQDHSTRYCQLGGRGNEKANGMVKYKDRIIITGMFTDTLAFAGQEIIASKFSSDVFIASVSSDCQPLNIISFTGESRKFPCSLTANETGIFLAGEFRNKMKAGKYELEAKGKEDIFVARIENCNTKNHLNISVKPLDENTANASWKLDAGPGYVSYVWNDSISLSRYYTAIQPETYMVTVTDTMGCIFTEEVNLFTNKSAVIVPDEEIKREFTLYPTITSGMIYWKPASIWEKNQASVKVFDSVGRLKSIEKINNLRAAVYRINLSGSSEGIYMIDISGNNFHETVKVIVKKQILNH